MRKTEMGGMCSEGGVWEGFGEDVGVVLGSRDVGEVEETVLDGFADVVMAEADMFGTGMVYGVQGQLTSALVVVVELDGGDGVGSFDSAEEVG